MKPKMLLIYAATRTVVFPIVKALEKYFDIDAIYAFDEEPKVLFECNLPKINHLDEQKENCKLDKYDIIFGFDPSTLDVISPLKNKEALKNKVFGCNVLDFPAHVFELNRNHHVSLIDRWKKWYEQYKQMDFITSWKENALTPFADCKMPKISLFGPAYPTYLDGPFKDEYQVCYSGTVKPDKGVHHIIEAASLVSNSPMVIAVGAGADLDKYAQYLRVSYKRFPGLGEKEKYKIYYESKFLICFPDNPWITPLCILEGLAIGKTGIVADWPENRRYYKDHVFYVEPFNILGLAKTMEILLKTPEILKEKEQGAREFFEKERTNEKWAEDLHGFLQSHKFI